MDTSIAIETRALTKHFPTTENALVSIFSRTVGPSVIQNVNLSIQTGELFGLLGPNGAGKTTLLKMLATLITPSSGEAWVNGHPLEDADSIKASLGFVTTDERSFYWRLTGRQNLTFFAHLHAFPPGTLANRVDELLAVTNLQDKADQPFRTYSTGMRQRLAIARALLHRPSILFLDEPTRGLDPPSIRALHQLIRHELTAKQGLTILLTTHWLQEAEGQIQAYGTLTDLRKMLGTRGKYHVHTETLTPNVRVTLEHYAPTALPSESIPSTLTLPDDVSTLNQVLDTLRSAQIPILSIAREELPLETIFDRFTDTTRMPSDTLPPSSSTTPAFSHPPPRLRPSPPGFGLGPNFFRIAGAFLQRDWHMETSYRLAFLLDFISIFFSVAVFYFVGELIGVQTAPFLAEFGGDYFAFVLVGIAFSRYFGVGISSFASNLRQAQTTGTLEAMLATPTPLSTIILSSSLWNFGFATLQVLAYLFVGWLFLDVPIGQGNLLAAVLILLLSIVVFSSLGILAASFVMVLKRGDPITWAFNVLFTLLGGVYYPITILPAWMQTLSTFLPVTYGLQAMRLALLQDAPWAAILPEIIPLALFGLVLLPLSLFAFRFAVRRARQDGSLAHF
ncbi:MAG: ABC transporter ATP-binding protein/permease [Anaerolineales bacterium]|nr:ABC transporter ATP-binding protein/permease [Anaerolineales bacterium]